LWEVPADLAEDIHGEDIAGVALFPALLTG